VKVHHRQLQRSPGLHNYDIRVHHTNTDTVERVEMQDIRQAALAAAWFAYSAAQADRKMPRPAAR
jgi:hypothetical protein